MDQVVEQTDNLLTAIQPTHQSSRHRDVVVSFLRSRLSDSLPSCNLALTGSTSLRTYLPTSDVNLDIVSVESSCASQIKRCSEVLTECALSPLSSPSTPTIRSVTVIPSASKTPILTCLVNNIGVTIAPLGVRNSMESEFLSAVNELCWEKGVLDKDGFKKFLLLLKTFFKMDSHIYTGGVPILRSTNPSTDSGGGLDGWTLCVMAVVFVVGCVEKGNAPPPPPTYVLFRDFLKFYGDFDWDNGVLRLKGGGPGTLGEALVERSAKMQQELSNLTPTKSTASFEYGTCNIIDPLDPCCNLGAGVSSVGVKGIRNGCREGGRACESLEIWGRNKGAEFPYSAADDGGSNPNSPRKRGGDEAAGSMMSSPLMVNTSPSPRASPSPSPSPSPRTGTGSLASDWGEDWFLQAFFPNTWNFTGPNLGLRPDIVEGPSVRWSDVQIERNQSLDGALTSTVKRGDTQKSYEIAMEKRRKEKERKEKEKEKEREREKEKEMEKEKKEKWKLFSLALLLYIFVPSLSTSNDAALSKGPSAPPSPPLPTWIALGASLSLGNTSPEEDSASFSWTKDGAPILGETGAFLRIADAQPGDEGAYARSRRGGDSRGSEAALTTTSIRVACPPSVEGHRGYYEVGIGGKVMLSVESTGGIPEPEYQWRLNGVDLEGRTRPMLMVNNISQKDGGTYTCLVRNEAGQVLWEEAVVVIKSDSVEAHGDL
ncbi:hypothetical protein TrRE_jg8296 [Triparma retinervis]|uniref:Ig-like domain-containing protein n=1 Tax=Triparma retinervis TaxID=2557542 RepID=A0A9W7A449_9STRA|nr:hypothetical protein TrRE_jg8296 [Triparma retinervis]